MPAVLVAVAAHLQYNMKIGAYIALVLLCGSLGATAQAVNSPVPKRTDDINKIDSRGLKNGMWLNKQGSRMGEDGFSEFGTYDHGNKTGLWYKLNGEGELLAIETFRNNILDGEVKYYDRGKLTCVGFYRGLNPAHDFDTVRVIDPTDEKEVTRIIPTDKGTMRHGMWRFYDPENGRLVREEDYQVDEMIYHKDYDYSKEDSVYYQKRNAGMPHNKGRAYQPPLSKQVSYIKGS